MITTAHKIKLNPTPEQEAYFVRACGVARFTWNAALSRYKQCKEQHEKVNWNQIKKDFRGKMDSAFPFVKEVTKCAPEEAIGDLRRAIRIYYKAKPKDRKLKFPGFRKRHKGLGSFGLANDKFSVSGHTARIPKCGDVNMTEPLRFAGKILSGRVREQSGKWYLVVTVVVEQEVKTVPSATVGIDFGLKSFATLSTGEVVETQGCLRRAEQRLKGLQRGLSRKKKGSQNRLKWKRKVTRAYERIRCQRADFLHKFSASVVERFGVICIEDLNLKALHQTRLAKSFSDAGVGEGIRQLEYKAEWNDRILQRVDRFYPSSKLCHVCGRKNERLTLSDRTWTCGGCGAVHERDENAAKNIELEGMRLLAGDGYLRVTPVEEEALAPVSAGTKPYSDETGTFYVFRQER